MQIDWVTIIAQIVNFLILVWLLKRFLYGPIVQAMQQRQERIADEMVEAREREAEAHQEARRHRGERQRLERRREELMDEARRDADQRRQQLIAEAREEVRGIERRWHENLRDERDAFIRQLRERMGREVCSVARQALADLANRELQAQVVDVFTERLGDLDEERMSELRAAVADSNRGPSLTTAFELSDRQHARLISAIREVLGEDVEITFREAGELLCGVELNVGGVKVAWSLASYLTALEESVIEAIERETAGEIEDEAAGEDMPPAESEAPADEEPEDADE
ncbi:MAG: F0F1 ATP synthase subunit delta [Armatimonadota bacterium]|jgi:F-type H+-transporting ATPase subunit b